MLVVTRKKDEKLMIGDDIEVQILRIGRENVRIGVKAPADVSIFRYEIYEAIQKREKAAATVSAEAGEAPASATDSALSDDGSPKTRAKAEG